MKISFKPYQNEHNSVMDTGERGKKTCNIDWKISMKILFHYPPTISSNPKILHVKAFLKTFPTKMKPTKCPAREKKMRQQKQKKRGGEKVKSKSQDCCVTFKLKNYLKILLSAHAWTSKANIVHLDQKAAKCMTCKQLFMAQRSDQKTTRIASKQVFSKISGANGLNSTDWALSLIIATLMCIVNFCKTTLWLLNFVES